MTSTTVLRPYRAVVRLRPVRAASKLTVRAMVRRTAHHPTRTSVRITAVALTKLLKSVVDLDGVKPAQDMAAQLADPPANDARHASDAGAAHHRRPTFHPADGLLARAVAAHASDRGVAATCLPRSLAMWTALRVDGHPARLCIGMDRRGSAHPAHAWVEVDGEPVLEAQDPRVGYVEFDLAGRFEPPAR